MYTFHQEDIEYTSISAFVRNRCSTVHLTKRDSFCIKAIMLFIKAYVTKGWKQTHQCMSRQFHLNVFYFFSM